jgi:very-short-patch-repair endonuclease
MKEKNHFLKIHIKTKRVIPEEYKGIEKCYYGCNQTAKFIFKNKKICCSDDWVKCPNKRDEIKKRNTGIKRGPCSEITKEKISVKQKGIKRKPHTLETKHLMSLSRKGKLVHTQESKNKIGESARIRMINGGFDKAHKAIKKISKQEKEIREMVTKIYPTCIFQYKVLNYFLDIAIPEYKIAIEYDGYYHFNCKENIDYYNNRQNKIENEGWIFLRYTMFDKFPSIKKIYLDIKKILHSNFKIILT